MEQSKKQKGMRIRLCIAMAIVLLLGGFYVLQNVLQKSVPGAKQVMAQGGYEDAK